MSICIILLGKIINKLCVSNESLRAIKLDFSIFSINFYYYFYFCFNKSFILFKKKITLADYWK